ncbi:elongation factor TFIIS domain 2-containing protein [Hymenopellis radicata]|nr:elongation factor TFIIS domain 2-containing protein [Hymenopellis radicata]
MDATELKGHVRQMQKLTEESELLALLETLRNGVVVKESLLRETRAGLAVGKLRSHPIKNVSDAAKELVKQWKQDVEDAKTAKPPSPPPPSAKPPLRSAKRDLTSIKVTDDPIRDKCIELMYDGLALDSDLATEEILALATIIEAAVFETHEGTTTEYKARFRTLFVALRHKDTSRWRDAVLNGAIEAERFAALSLADLMQIS